MRRRRRQFLVLIAIFLVPLWLPRSGIAQTPDADNQRTDLLDFVLVLDQSGSMRYNDPDRARVDAAQLFVDLPLQHDRVAVVGFGEGAETIVPLQEIEGNRSRILEQLSGVGESGEYTMMREGLDQADALLDGRRRQRRSAVVVLTDGELQADDIPPEVDLSSYLEATYGTAADLADNRSMVVSLAFTERANVNVLRRLAEQGGGFTEVIESPQQTGRTFYRILRQLVPSGETRMSENETRKAFRVPENARKVSLIAFKSEGVDAEIPIGIVGPDGEQVEGTTRDSRFYTVLNIEDPAAGQYVATVPTDNRLDVQILVVNQVRLEVVRPGAGNRLVAVGEEVPIELRALGSPVDSMVGEGVTPAGETVPLSFEPPVPDTRGWTTDFTAHRPGTYRVTAAATDSTGRIRLCSTRFQFTAIRTQPVDLSVEGGSSVVGTAIRFTAAVPDTSLLRDLFAAVTAPNGEVDTVRMQQVDGETDGSGTPYSARYASTERPGLYRARVRARFQVDGETLTQTTQQSVPKVLELASSPRAELDSGQSARVPLRLTNRGDTARVTLQSCGADGVELRPETDTVDLPGGETTSLPVTIETNVAIVDSVVVNCRGGLLHQRADGGFSYAAVARPDRLSAGELLLGGAAAVFLLGGIAFLYCRTRPSFAEGVLLRDEGLGMDYRLEEYQGVCGGTVSVRGDLVLEGVAEAGVVEFSPGDGEGVTVRVKDDLVDVEVTGEPVPEGEERTLFPGDSLSIQGREYVVRRL